MKGIRRSVIGASGTPIGLLTAGVGPPLLLVHGGCGQIERWAPLWDGLSEHWSVTAMDRRGRGSSGDGDRYSIDLEYEDVAAVARFLADEADAPIEAFGHSYGATCVLGSAECGAPISKAVLYEPPGSSTVSAGWVAAIEALLAKGQSGAAMERFLSEILALSGAEIEALKNAPATYDILGVLAATLEREAHALLSVDLLAAASAVPYPTALLVGERSPTWARQITTELQRALPAASVIVMPDVGHEAIDTAPAAVLQHLKSFLGDPHAR